MSGFSSHSGSSASAPYSSGVIERSAYWHDSTNSSRLSCQSARTTRAGSVFRTASSAGASPPAWESTHLDHLPEPHVGVIDRVSVLIERANLHVGNAQADFNFPGHSCDSVVDLLRQYVGRRSALYCSGERVPASVCDRVAARVALPPHHPRPPARRERIELLAPRPPAALSLAECDLVRTLQRGRDGRRSLGLNRPCCASS